MSVNLAPFKQHGRVNLSNFFSLKKILDDEIKQFFKANEYVEHNIFTDLRNIVIIISVALGLLAQFYFKFPDDSKGILGCILGYAVCTFIAFLIERYGMKGCLVLMRLQSSTNANANAYAIGIKSELKPLQKHWEIELHSRVNHLCFYKNTMNITHFFDTNGEFVKRYFDREFKVFWNEFQLEFKSRNE